MSGHSQRAKGKPVQRVRNQRMSSHMVKSQGNGARAEENLGIFTTYEFTNVIGRHLIGNIGEITTTDDEKFTGLVKAISPSGDLGLTYAYGSEKGTKNGKVTVSERLVPFGNLKLVHISNVKLYDCLIDDTKTDAESQNDVTPESLATAKPLVPFFAPSEAPQDCVLDQGGFSAEEMFKTNEQLFSVSTTYNPDLREYTTPVDRNAPDYSETEARCAKLAMEFEKEQALAGSLDDACDHALEDEEEKYSAVSRKMPKDVNSHPNRFSNRYSRGPHDKSTVAADTVVSTHKRLTHNFVHSVKPSSIDRESESATVSSTSDIIPKLDSLSIHPTTTQATDAVSTHKSSTDNVVVSASAATSISSNTEASAVVPVTSEEKPKRSTLDPNAPEFQPASLQYGAMNQSAQPIPVPIPAFSVPPAVQTFMTPVNNSQTNNIPMQSVQTALNSGQSQLYAASSIPYGSQAGHIQQMIGNAVPAAQHMRAGSLPPALPQQHFTPNASFLLHAQQSGLPAHLLNPSSVIVAGPNPMRYPGPTAAAAMAILRQRSTEPASTHSAAHSQQQSSAAAGTFQTPAIYQMSQAGAMPLIVPGHPQMGLHFVSPGLPGTVSSMVGGMGMPQTAGQQNYPAHAMYQLQPAAVQIPNVPAEQVPVQSSASQQPHGQQAYGHAHESQNFPFPTAPQAMMFAGQAGAPAYYGSGLTFLPGPGMLNPAVQAGFIPMINQSNQNAGNVAHANQLEPSQQPPQAQFPPSNCQPPQWMSQYPYQAYQALAAFVANGGNPPTQPH